MAKRIALWGARVVVTLLLLVGLYGLAHFPMGSPPTEGMVRLAWRAVGEKVRICHARSTEELMQLPPHMRRPQECRQQLLPYRLQVTVDGRERIDRTVAPAGTRGDRPLYVQDDLALMPGRYRVEISFVPAVTAEASQRFFAEEYRELFDQLTAEERAAFRATLQNARRYADAREIDVRAGRITLISLEEDSGTFRLQGG